MFFLFLFLAYTYYFVKFPLLGIDFGWISEPAYNYVNHGIFGTISRAGLIHLDEATYWFPPVFFLLEMLTYKIIGFGLLQNILLLTSILGLTIVFTFFLAEKLFDRKIAALTLLVLFSNTVFFILAWVENRPDVLVALFDVLAFLAFYRYAKRAQNQKPNALFLLLSGLFVGLAGMSHLVGFLMGASLVVCMAIHWLKNRTGAKTLMKNLFVFSSGAAMPVLLWLLYAVQNTAAFTQQFLTRSTVLSIQSLSLEAGRYKLFFGTKAMIVLGPLFIAATIYGIAQRKKEPVGYVTAVIVTHLLLFPLVSSKTLQHFSSIIPFWSILLAVMLYDGIRNSRRVAIRILSGFLIFVIFASGIASHALWTELRMHTDNYNYLLPYLGQKIPHQGSDKILSTSPYFFAFLENMYDIEAVSWRVRINSNESLANILHEVRPKYFILDSFVRGLRLSNSSDPFSGQLSRMLEENATKIEELCFRGNTLVLDPSLHRFSYFNEGMSKMALEVIRNPDLCLDPVVIYKLNVA